MINNKEKEECCGCTACYNICPVNAIQMYEDEQGFKYPVIDDERCINCDTCEIVCPILNNGKIGDNLIVYACYNKDEDIRTNSSSGGVFTLNVKNIKILYEEMRIWKVFFWNQYLKIIFGEEID